MVQNPEVIIRAFESYRVLGSKPLPLSSTVTRPSFLLKRTKISSFDAFECRIALLMASWQHLYNPTAMSFASGRGSPRLVHSIASDECRPAFCTNSFKAP